MNTIELGLKQVVEEVSNKKSHLGNKASSISKIYCTCRYQVFSDSTKIFI